jgi:hypothetical protein
MLLIALFLIFSSTVLEAQTIAVQGCAQYGAGGTHTGWGLPYESFGGAPSGGGGGTLTASVYEDGCYFGARYQLALDNLTFKFCSTGCYSSVCDNWYARSSYFNLGSNHSVEVRIRIADFGAQVYAGCEGEAGDWGRTFIHTGNPTINTSVRLTWQDMQTGQTGFTWHSIGKSEAKMSGQHLWSYGDDGIYESSSHTNGRTLRIAFNSQASVVQGGKRYGISATTQFAKLIEAKGHSLVSFESVQDQHGIIQVQAWARLVASVTYLHSQVVAGPFVQWVNN